MKKIFLFVLLVAMSNVWSQAKHFDLQWQHFTQKQLSDKKLPEHTPLFQSKYYQYKADNVYFSAVWQDRSLIDPASVKLSHVSYSPVSAGLQKLLSFKKLPAEFKATLMTSYAREDIYATLEVNAFIKKNNRFYKLDAFEVTYAYQKNSLQRQKAQNIYDSQWANGSWYRFKIDKTGVYKLDRNFLKGLGIDVNNIDPRQIKIMGNGGKVMPLRNDVPYPEDIMEVAVEVVGEQDGSFDAEDFVLFYAVSDKEWSDDYDSNLNIYTNDTYYYVKIDGGNGKRIQAYQTPAGTPVETYTTYLARKFYEQDKTIFTYMGRKVFDEPMGVSTNSKSIDFTFENMDLTQNLGFKVEAGIDKGNTALRIKVNGQDAGQILFASIIDYAIGAESNLSKNIQVSSNQIKFDLNFQTNGLFDAHLYLQYLNVWAYCHLKQSGKQFQFFHPEADVGNGIGSYHFTNADDITRVWDVTDPYNPAFINNSQSDFVVKFDKSLRKRFIAIDKNDFYKPEKPAQVKQENQNLHKEVFYHSGNFQDVDYIIVTPKFLRQEAEKFANLHRQNGLNVFVANLSHIYKEFGNGEQDIAAIRNFVKYVYNNASAPDKRVRFLMLFGDASNDFKNVVSEYKLTNGKNTNIVPIYESLNWYSLVSSVASDDFFVMMDDTEGDLDRYEKPDIAVGRLLVRNQQEAAAIYKKYTHYLSDKAKQNWRTFITLWADDADRSSDLGFTTNTDTIAQKINQIHPEINVNKLYQDAYKQIVTPGGARYPDAKRDLFNYFEKGTLIIGYIGHGNEVALTHERMLTMEDVLKLHNIDRLPLMTTMTCEFAKFDNPTRETAAEHLIWNEDGGVLEMVSTIREIYTGNAENMNTDFYDALLGLLPNLNGQIIKNPAEALRMAKLITTSGDGKFNIAFLGDPGFDLGFQQPKIVLKSVNNQPTDTLKALQHVIIKGEVQDADGNLLTQYQGQLNPIVFDKYVSAHTLDNDHTGLNVQFKKLGSKLFQGKADIINGKFRFEFIVPKDINLSYGQGRFSFYAQNQSDEKIGYDESIVIGGVDLNAEEDNKPPVIQAFLNDENFVSGGITDANPYLVLKLEDEHGINTIGGIGHDITAYIDDDQTNVFILNDFYETENNTYQRGKVHYRLYNLKPGWHTLTAKAWDVYNNSATITISFQVVKNEEIQLDHVLNYPNPFVNYTEFWFNHNHPFENLDVMIQVYTISGKLVWQHRQEVLTQGFLSREISWDGRDNFGNKLAKGVYVYKISVRTLSGKTAQKIEKLVIL